MQDRNCLSLPIEPIFVMSLDGNRAACMSTDIHEIHPSGVPRTLPQRQMSAKPRSGGCLLLLRRRTPLTRRSVVYFCSGAHRIAGTNTTLIWASTTPVRLDDLNGAGNARINKRNSIARAFASAEGTEIDHQHALMLKHQDLYDDHDNGLVNFDPKGSDMQGDQAAARIRAALVREHAK